MREYLSKDSRKTASAQKECGEKNIVVYWDKQNENWICKKNGTTVFEFETGKKFNELSLKAHFHRIRTREGSILKVLQEQKEKNQKQMAEESAYINKHNMDNAKKFATGNKKYWVPGV